MQPVNLNQSAPTFHLTDHQRLALLVVGAIAMGVALGWVVHSNTPHMAIPILFLLPLVPP